MRFCAYCMVFGGYLVGVATVADWFSEPRCWPLSFSIPMHLLGYVSFTFGNRVLKHEHRNEGNR